MWGIYDANGNFIDNTNDASGIAWNRQVTFTPYADGVHYVAARGYVSVFEASLGTYTLSVVVAPDDFTADTGTTGRVAVGGTATGDIERPGDRDWFAVELEAGKTYQFDMKGLWTGDGTLSRTKLGGDP